MSSQFDVDITAVDGSAKGFDAFDKRARKSAKAQEKLGLQGAKAEADRLKAREKAEAAVAERRAKTSLKAHGRGFAAAERAFGGGTISSHGKRLQEVADAGSHIRSAFAAASQEGAGLSERIGAIGVAAAGATGAVIGLAFGAAKLATSWVRGEAALGRLSAGIGVSTDQLQRWQGAGERFGVDKDTMGAALGGVGQTLHDASYGTNNTALAALNQLGIGIKRDKNGVVDTDAMAASLSDAIARQKDPYTQRQIAQIFGIPEGALPAFRQGSSALRAQGEDFARYGAFNSSADVGLASRLYGKGVQLRQIGERGLQGVQIGAARAGEGVVDGLLASGRGLADGSAGGAVAGAASHFVGAVERTFAPAVHVFQEGAHEISVSAERLISFFEAKGRSRIFATGLAANAYAESGLRADRHQVHGPAQGLFQLEGPRRRLFEQVMGKKFEGASWQDQASFANWELDHTERRAARKLAMARSFAEAGAAGSLYFERPADAAAQAAHRGRIAAEMGAGTFDHRHKVDVELHDRRTKVKVASSTAGQGGAPAVAYASAGSGL